MWFTMEKNECECLSSLCCSSQMHYIVKKKLDTDKETISILFNKLDKQQNSPQNHDVGFCVNKQTVFSVMQYKSGVNPLTYKKFKEVMT